MANRDENPRWQSPGGKLLRRILPAWRASLPTDLADELDPFVDENLAELTRMVGFWIVEDAQRESRQLISDAALQDAADALKDADELSPLVGLVRPVVGHFWGMQALMSRAQEIELPTNAIADAFRRAAEGRDAQATETILLALEKGPPAGWSTPEYSRRGPVDTSTSRGRQTLDRRVHAALAQRGPLTVSQVHVEVGGKLPEVEHSLRRLEVKQCVIGDGKQWWWAKHRCPSSVDTRSHWGRVGFDRHIEEVLALHSPLTAADIERAVGGTNVQVRVALNRLIHKGLVTWGRKERGGTVYYTSEEGEKSHAG